MKSILKILLDPDSFVEELKVLLSLNKERTDYWLAIIHSCGFCAEEGQRLGLSCSKIESESKDILIQFIEFSNVHNSTIVIESPTSLHRTFITKCTNVAAEAMGFHDRLL